MTKHEASRTLVKSPPELWAELSDQESLAGHLAEPFGEIRITRLDPETAVAWEGERASGTVRIESSGWGTRVTLTATAVQDESPAPESAAPPPPPPVAPPPPPAAPSPSSAAEVRGLRTRMRGWLRARPAGDPERPLVWPARGPAAAEQPRADHAVAAEQPRAEPVPQPVAPLPDPPSDPDAALKRILDDLGAARHRPFSRS